VAIDETGAVHIGETVIHFAEDVCITRGGRSLAATYLDSGVEYTREPPRGGVCL